MITEIVLCTKQIIYHKCVCYVYNINTMENIICRLFAATDDDIENIDHEVDDEADHVNSQHLTNLQKSTICYYCHDRFVYTFTYKCM